MISRILLSLLVTVVCSLPVWAQEHNAQELRVTQPTNGQSFVLLPSSSTVQQTIIFPTDPPLTAGFALVVRSVSGNTVTTAWAPPWDPLASSYWVRKTADQAEAAQAYVDATDMRFYVAPNKAYYVEGFFRINNSGDANADVRIDFEVPSGTSINYYYVSSTQTTGAFQVNDADVAAGFTESVDALLQVNSAQVRYYNIQGYIVTGTTPGFVQLRFRRDGGAGSVNLLQNSVMKIFTD
ncbi:MAG: hypothetical protein IPF59_08920 [Ignavibacteria bacterium]|nr:hypothetical protein [Ignavibacteria bacterium]